MKNIKRIISLFLVINFSCSDQIDLTPVSDPSVTNFFRNEADIEVAVVGAYDALQLIGQYSWGYPFLTEVRSDNSWEFDPTGSGGIFYDIDIFNVNTGNEVVESAWIDGYDGIQRVNIILNRIDDIEMDASLKEVRIGEMKFLRGLTYFNLVRFFGDVPMVLTETVDVIETFEIARSPKEEIYDQIIQDLSEAASSLPATQAEPGRATSGAAHALLGKVYLTLENYDQAIVSLRNVTGYSLMENYADIFGVDNENNAESIFEVQFISGSGSAITANGLGDGLGEGSPFPNLFAPSTDLVGGGSAVGNNRPTLDLYDSYDASDLRRDVNIGILSETTDEGEVSETLYPAKLMATVVGDLDSDVNSIVLRYADVVLMLAEALNSNGYTAGGEAFDLLNQIRDRAGLSTLTSAELPDQTSFALAIENERRWEFAFENHRWFDLVRTGRALEVMNDHTSQNVSFNVEDFQTIYPVPQREIDANPDVLDQNPGY